MSRFAQELRLITVRNDLEDLVDVGRAERRIVGTKPSNKVVFYRPVRGGIGAGGSGDVLDTRIPGEDQGPRGGKPNYPSKPDEGPRGDGDIAFLAAGGAAGGTAGAASGAASGTVRGVIQSIM